MKFKKFPSHIDIYNEYNIILFIESFLKSKGQRVLFIVNCLVVQ